MSVCLYICKFTMYARCSCPGRPEEGVGSPRTGVRDSHGCWELNLDPLKPLLLKH